MRRRDFARVQARKLTFFFFFFFFCFFFFFFFFFFFSFFVCFFFSSSSFSIKATTMCNHALPPSSASSSLQHQQYPSRHAGAVGVAHAHHTHRRRHTTVSDLSHSSVERQPQFHRSTDGVHANGCVDGTD
jgi:hypothetical protein